MAQICLPGGVSKFPSWRKASYSSPVGCRTSLVSPGAPPSTHPQTQCAACPPSQNAPIPVYPAHMTPVRLLPSVAAIRSADAMPRCGGLFIASALPFLAGHQREAQCYRALYSEGTQQCGQPGASAIVIMERDGPRRLHRSPADRASLLDPASGAHGARAAGF